MSDLISREATKMIIMMKPYDWSNITERREMLNEIDNLPSAEIEEQTAKVEIVEKPNVYKCSKCGQYFHSTAWGSPVLYCSRCGAKLDWRGE